MPTDDGGLGVVGRVAKFSSHVRCELQHVSVTQLNDRAAHVENEYKTVP